MRLNAAVPKLSLLSALASSAEALAILLPIALELPVAAPRAQLTLPRLRLAAFYV